MAVFATISMLLAAIGIHGVVSYVVAQRTREFGLRMALGSTPIQLKSLLINKSFKTALIGLLIGMVGAASLASALRSLLYGLVPLDPVVMGSISAVLLTVAFIANYLRARREARTDPLEALRQD